ncbi:MAG: GAF domain-containing protein [Rikenellaceae bacterium]|nr:GAF domain-containing protein [Rikenellaceae bacterium]
MESVKYAMYSQLLIRIRSLVATDGPVPSMANIAAALKEACGFFWVGFYLVDGDRLTLGPFQGPVACSQIAFGQGVCGTAWKERRTIIVPDVERFPGHIACSALSRSEIVVPILLRGQVVGVLDADSTELDRFDKVDAEFLAEICRLVSTKF